MKLQTKLLLVLLTGLLTAYLGSSLIQHYLGMRAINRFSKENQSKVEASQWREVERLNYAIEIALLNSMAKGEMEQLAETLESQRHVEGLQEVSVYDSKGIVKYSSDPARLKKDLPSELKDPLLASGQTVKRRTDQSFEIYHPVRIKESCLTCHVDNKVNDIRGIMSMRFSSEPMKAAEKGWVDFNQSFDQFNHEVTGVTAVVLILVVSLLAGMSVHYLMAVPLNALRETH